MVCLFDSQSLFLPRSIGRMWVKSTSNLVWKARVCFYSYTSRCVPHFYSWPVKWVGGAVFRGSSEKCDTECLDASGIFAIWPTLGGRLPSVPKNIILSSKLQETLSFCFRHHLIKQIRHHLMQVFFQQLIIWQKKPLSKWVYIINNWENVSAMCADRFIECQAPLKRWSIKGY